METRSRTCTEPETKLMMSAEVKEAATPFRTGRKHSTGSERHFVHLESQNVTIHDALFRRGSRYRMEVFQFFYRMEVFQFFLPV